MTDTKYCPSCKHPYESHRMSSQNDGNIRCGAVKEGFVLCECNGIRIINKEIFE